MKGTIKCLYKVKCLDKESQSGISEKVKALILGESIRKTLNKRNHAKALKQKCI